MHVLVVTSDQNVLREGSIEREDLKKYAALVDRLVVVVLHMGIHAADPQKAGDHFWIIPVRSLGLWAVRAAIRAVRRELYFQGTLHVDVVVAQEPGLAGIVGYRIARRYKKPLHLFIKENLFSSRMPGRGLLTPLRAALARLLARRAQGLCVGSEAVHTALADIDTEIADRAIVTPFCIDVQALQNEPVRVDLAVKYPRFKFIVLMVAPFVEEQNIETGIAAFVDVVREYEHAGLVIVGKGWRRWRLARVAKRLGLRDRVVFEEPTPNISSYFKTSQLFLETAFYEEFDDVLSKAAAARCAVVTTDVGMARVIVKDGESGFICDAHDPKTFAAAMVKLLRDTGFREQVRLNGMLAIEQYAEEKVLQDAHYKLQVESWRSAVERMKTAPAR